MRTGTPGFDGGRLRLARETRGLQQVALADMVGITRQTLSNYESGATSPGLDTLARLAGVLAFPTHFFTKPSVGHFGQQPVFYRARRSSSKADRKQAEARITLLAEVVDTIEEYVNLPDIQLPDLGKLPSDPTKISDELVDDIAAAYREAWRLQGKPIAHAVRLLESKGIVVGAEEFEAEDIDGLSAVSQVTGRPFVLLSTYRKTAVRLRFNAAHELGELALHRHLDANTSEKNSKLLDRQAHRFAGALLLPAEPFLHDLYSVTLERLRALKPRWRVSIGAMIERLRSLNVLSADAHRSLRIALTRRGWHRIEPYDDQWDAEEPVMLKQAVDVVVGNGVTTVQDLVHQTAIDEPMLSRIAHVPEAELEVTNLIRLPAV